jgi:hypothetical protein
LIRLDGFSYCYDNIPSEVCASYDTVFLYIDAQPIEFTLNETNLDCYQDSSGEILVNAIGGFRHIHTVTDVNSVTSLYNTNPVTGISCRTYAVRYMILMVVRLKH